MDEKNDYLKYIKQSFELKNQKLYKEAIEVLYKVMSDEADTKTIVEVVSQIGDLHILLKNYDRAIEQFREVLEIDPSHAYSKNKLYEIYFEIKEYEKALKIIEEICKESKKPADYVKYFSVLLKLGRVDEILEKYKMLDNDIKEDPHVLYIISLLKKDEKKELLTKVVAKMQGFNEAKFDLALIYFEEGQYPEAEKLIDEILKTKKDALCYYYKALIQIERREYFLAIDNLHLAIKASKGLVQEFYFELAKAYMELNWFEEAISTIKNSISLCIEQSEDKLAIDKRYLLLAWVFEKQGDFDNALFNLTLIGGNSPVRAQADILEGLVYYRKGDVIKAKTILENIYESDLKLKDDLTLVDTLGAIYRDLKLNSKASEFFECHLKCYPDSLHTVCEYVDLLIDIEQYEKAEELIKKYSKIGKVPSFLNSKARIAYRKKDYDGAISSLKELIECDKNNAEAYYFTGLILNQKEKYKEALSFIETALELNPRPAKYYAQAAYSNLNLGLYDEAMLYIKEAIEIEPNDLNYKKFAAEISEKSGSSQEAEFWNLIVSSTESVLKSGKMF